MSLSAAAAPVDDEQQEQDGGSQYATPSASQSEEERIHSVPSTQSIPILPGQILTIRDHEESLVERMDELIQNFLSRINARNPYHGLLQWSFDDERHVTYNVVVLINQPVDFI